MNATDLFELTQKDEGLLPHSESYWSTLFALYLLHLSQYGTHNSGITIRRCTDKSPHYFERKLKSESLNLTGLISRNIAIEPNGLKGLWKDTDIDRNEYLTGINPDVVFKIPTNKNTFSYVLIENKVKTGADLNSNQMTSYPDLIKELNEIGIDCQLFLLQSLGADKIYNSAIKLQSQFQGSDRFGVILWEDIIRCMSRDNFRVSGLQFHEWLPYTKDGKTDCKDWD